MINKRLICWFSCGAASAVATKLAIKEWKGEVVVCYQDTGSEHPDNKRFLKDCEEWFGQEIITLKSDKYKDIWEVFDKTKYLVGVAGARCTGELKRKLAEKFINFGHDKEVLGYTSEESHRVSRFVKNNPERDVWPILIEKHLEKDDCLGMLDRAGIEIPVMYKLGYRNNNCLAGDTKIITSRGAVPIKSIVGKPTMIRTSIGFEEAVVKDYGLQQCYEVDIARDGMIETITASYNHRWYVRPRRYRDELVVIPTLALQVGFKIPTAYKGCETNPTLEGIQHGIVYGDGTRIPNNRTAVTLCGDKVSLKRFFPKFKGKGNTIGGMCDQYKELPSIAHSPQYLAGFVAGLMATDGCFKGGITLSQVKDMPKIKDILESIGLTVQPIKSIRGDTNYKKDRTLDTLRIISNSFPPELDIRNQRKNHRPKHRADDCEIIAIRKIGNKRVYCPTTSTSDIALEYGIITGQCIGCVKGGRGYWNRIRETHPEVFDRMAKVERKLDVAILKKDVKGERVRVFLDELDPKAGNLLTEPSIQCGLFCIEESENIKEVDDCDD